MSKKNTIVAFKKMHGAGNDFIVMDARPDQFPKHEIIKRAPLLCHRRTGIGADGILLLENSATSDYRMHYMNADGSEAGMCGNGARCLAQFAVQLGFPGKLTFQMNDKVYLAEVHSDYVSVAFPVNPQPVKRRIEGINWYELNTGTEHVVSIDNSYASASDDVFRTSGRNIRNRSDLFPIGTNVNFANIVNENRLRLVTYERGVEDLTLACGTGAIATAITWEYCKYHNLNTDNVDLMNHHIQVDCPGGPLEVTFDVDRRNGHQNYKNIKLHGPVVSVFEGTISL